MVFALTAVPVALVDVDVVGDGIYIGVVCVGDTAVELELPEPLELLEPPPRRLPNNPPPLLELPPPRRPRSGSSGFPADVPVNGFCGPPVALGIMPRTGPIKDAANAPPNKAAIY